MIISSLKLLSAWRRRALKWKVCQCNAASCWWWCEVGSFFWWSNQCTKLLGCCLIWNKFCRYLHFDFHHICGHVHFERLSILYEQIEDFFIKNRYDLLWVQSSCIYCVVLSSFLSCMESSFLAHYQPPICDMYFGIT